MAERMIGPFEVGERIGVGGMGIVYRATYTKNGAPVALKILSPELSDTESLQRRFEREVSILKKLQHPHIVRYYGGGKFGSQRFYAMELVTGGSVEELLKQKKRLPWEEALDIAMQVAKALEHEAGVIHRDLKPANLLLTRDGVVKLTDFGIARDTTASALTAAGKTVGTYAYMAPEQIRGKPPVDKKTDLYALGCVLFEMISGETPFQSENQGEMLMMHLQEEPPRITSLVPDCPMFIEDLIFHLLEKDAQERPFDALDVQTKIDGVRKKVADQKSIAAAQMEAATASTVLADATSLNELKSALGKTKKKKKKKDNSPFYERVWFLGLCLSILLGTIGWSLWSAWFPSEAAMMSRADQLMKSEFTLDHVRARDDFLKPLLKQFPNGKQADRVQELIVAVDKEETLNKMRARVKLRQPPLNEAELQYLNAEKFREFGDLFTARRKHTSIIELFKENDEFRIYVLLSQDKVEEIEAQIGNATLASFLNKRLQDAETSQKNNMLSEAEAIWTSIKTLYDNVEEASAHVAYARKKLADPKAEADPPPWKNSKSER
jgi:eukaryotic-like serine/threonine-protein kinase